MSVVGAVTVDSLISLRDELRRFAAEREWDQFHTPKNLAMAMSVETAEVLEHFQWTSDSTALATEKLDEVRMELADVLLYLIRLADKIDVDLYAAAQDKIRLNVIKYPVDEAKGNSKKYTEL